MIKITNHINYTVKESGHVIKYKIINDTAYHVETPDKVVSILEEARQNKDIRLRLCYGDTDTGLDWSDVYDTMGYIGRSTGSIKVPLLIKTSRSSGGGALLDHCIIKIEQKHSNNSHYVEVYRHPQYHLPTK